MTLRTGLPPSAEVRTNRPGPRPGHRRSVITPDAPVGGPTTETIRDVTELQDAKRTIAVHRAVSNVLAGWDTFPDSEERLLHEVAGALGCSFGALWLPDGDVLIRHLVWTGSALELSGSETDTFGQPARRGVGFLGRVWDAQAPMTIANVATARGDHRLRTAAAARPHGAMAFPAVHAGDVLAVLEFCSHEELRPTTSTETMRALGSQLGEFLSHRTGQLRAPALTRRELEVLQLAADGFSRAEIAEQLTVSWTTVATHLKHIGERLGVHGRTSAVAIGIRQGLIR